MKILLTVDLSSNPLIFRQSSIIGTRSSDTTLADEGVRVPTFTRISIVPFSTGDIFSSVRFSL
ncbi:MAG TPA: hypothetical protein PLK77_09430 [Pyrinomonadaceae bacterium]|nr:hypothetical protein [Pyrinomonadaceae bacterium]